MLETLRGTLRRKDTEEVIVETAGIGFAVGIPASTFAALPEVGEEVLLFTQLSFNVQEGEFNLFGFATEMERAVYRIFLTIPGIGPRKGLMILSQVNIGDFARAIQDRNVAYLSQIKGVGRKTAERLLVELRDKMLPFLLVGAGGAAGTEGAAGGTGGAGEGSSLPPGQNIADAVAGLTGLGCPYTQAARAVARAVERLGASASTAELLKEALKHR